MSRYSSTYGSTGYSRSSRSPASAHYSSSSNGGSSSHDSRGVYRVSNKDEDKLTQFALHVHKGPFASTRSSHDHHDHHHSHDKRSGSDRHHHHHHSSSTSSSSSRSGRKYRDRSPSPIPTSWQAGVRTPMGPPAAGVRYAPVGGAVPTGLKDPLWGKTQSAHHGSRSGARSSYIEVVNE